MLESTYVGLKFYKHKIQVTSREEISERSLETVLTKTLSKFHEWVVGWCYGPG